MLNLADVKKVPVSRKKKKLGSYPYLSVIFSITLALFVIGLFGLLLLHTSKLTEMIRENIEIQVYLSKDITNNQRIQIQKTLSSKPYAAKKNDEVQISYVSREKAAEEFIRETGEDFTNFLGENPLRDAYILKISPEYQETEKIRAIGTEIEAISGVFEVVYMESLVDTINRNMTKISNFLLGFDAILQIAVIILINNTIKLALFSQRFLIRSMQLIGAKSSFIKKPFLWRAILHGMLAGIISSAMLYALMSLANQKIENLELLQELNKILILFAGLLVMGALIGFSSTLRAINKYLKLSLDELY